MEEETSNHSLGGSGGLLKMDPLFTIRSIFYVVSPNETSFENIQQVPTYVTNAIPFLLFFTLLEFICSLFFRFTRYRATNVFSSIAAGIISQFPTLLIRNMEALLYVWFYDKFHLVDLPWQSSSTWLAALLFVDMTYYWLHRASHEINFMWAAHQVHHSSEDYNLSTALRQSVLQRYNTVWFHLPMALFIPPQVFLVHLQLNLIYQFWIHTEAVKTLGPLEWILNTPSHHRVHHGRNRYCIDKNYAGVLIIWDRMFGTFAKEEGKIAYGLVHPLMSWDVLDTQLCHWRAIVRSLRERSGFSAKLSTLLKGPGWEENKPRLGYTEDIPVTPDSDCVYDTTADLWLNVYIWTQFATMMALQFPLLSRDVSVTPAQMFLALCFFLWTLTNCGKLYERKAVGAASDVLRCLVYLLVDLIVCWDHASCASIALLPRFIMTFSTVAAMLMFPKLADDPAKKKLL